MIDWFKEQGFIKKDFFIDKQNYEVFVKKKINTPIEYPRIALVCYQPTQTAKKLVELCIESIKKFTDSDYELWVIEDYSPEEHLKWIDGIEKINIAYVRTPTRLERGSYSNAISLEVAARVIDPDSKYLMSLHSDAIVCRYGWLSYLMSKFDSSTGTAGFRLTKFRIPEGTLHVCGYIMDYQLFKKYNLDFFAQYPELDISDKVSYILREKGYKVFATPNTFDNPETISKIPSTLEMSRLNVTRAFNEKDEVIFMHLGRGIPKAQGDYFKRKIKESKGKCGPEEWIKYISKKIFSEPYLAEISDKNANEFLTEDISIRELYVKNLFDQYLNLLPENSEILYIGNMKDNGKKMLSSYRNFGIDYHSLVETINDNEDEYSFKFENLSLKKKNYDCLIFKDLVPITINIKNLINQSYRLLDKSGILIMILPYILYDNKISLDDLAYSYKNISNTLWKEGFREVSVEILGSHNSLIYYIDNESRNLKNINRKSFINRSQKKKLLKVEKRLQNEDNYLSKDLTLGYGIIAIK